MRAAFIGLGVMGFPMAGHLARAGHDVVVYNRTPAKAEAWVARHGGRGAATPAAAAEGAEVVMTCVGNDADLRGVVLGPDGAFAGMATGAVLVDHTTASADVARELAAIAGERGLAALDAPISGGQAGAEAGQLTVMVGGEAAALERVRPAIATYAKAITLMGPAGSGQLTKMMNQICIAGLVQALAEALDFGRRAGLDVPLAVGAISKGAAQSWTMDNRASTMIEDRFDFGFAVDWMRKDLGIVLATARATGASLPVTALVDQFYAKLQEQGEGRSDVTSLIRLLRSRRT